MNQARDYDGRFRRQRVCVEDVASIRARDLLRDDVRPGAPSVAVVVEGRQRVDVSLVWQQQPGGGAAALLVCPCCLRARRSLYAHGAGVACRVCLRLVYRSQTVDRFTRAWARVRALEARVRWSSGRPRRPPRMHRRTFKRLVAELRAAELATVDAWAVPAWVARALTESGAVR